MDAIGNHPKVFFLSLTLISIDGLFIFKGGYRRSIPLPKYVTVGSDTKAQGYVRSASQELVSISQNIYKVSKQGHYVTISTDPIIYSGDGLVRNMFTGGTLPNDQACSIFEVFQHLCLFCYLK